MGVQMAPVKLFLGGRVVSGKPCSPHPFPGRGSIPAGGQFLQNRGVGQGLLGANSGIGPGQARSQGGIEMAPHPGSWGGGGFPRESLGSRFPFPRRPSILPGGKFIRKLGLWRRTFGLLTRAPVP